MNINKLFSSAAVVVMVGVVGVGSALAQDDVEPVPMPPVFGGGCFTSDFERPDLDREALLAEVGITPEDIVAAREDGTLRELMNSVRDELDVLREEMQASFAAEAQAATLACVDEALADGRLTQEQADALTEAINAGDLREALESGEFDDVFPRLGIIRDRIGERGDGERPFGERGGFGQRGGFRGRGGGN